MCCVLQDPPGIQLYVAVKTVVLNGVQLNKYRCWRGSNSLEGLHAHLYNAIPSHKCAIMPFQVSNKMKTLQQSKLSVTHFISKCFFIIIYHITSVKQIQ